MSLATSAVGTTAVGTSGAVNSGLVASALASSTATANLTTAIRFVGSAVAVATGSATMTVSTGFRGAAVAQSIATGTLTSSQAAPTFTPSAARTILVNATAPVFSGSKWWNLTDTKKPRGLKDPDATIDITFDWSDWLADIGSAVISDVTFTVTGSNKVNVFNDNTTATVFISGGVLGIPSTVACKIQTNTTPARTDERTVYIDIADE